MAGRNSSNARIVKNSLLSAAGHGFEDFSGSAVLFPASENNPTLLSHSDGGEVDSFLGQNAPSVPPLAADFSLGLITNVSTRPTYDQGPISSKPPQGYAPQPFSTPIFTPSDDHSSLPVLQVAPVSSTVFPHVVNKQDHDKIVLPQHGSGETVYTSPFSSGVDTVSSGLSSVSLFQTSTEAKPTELLNISPQESNATSAVFTSPPVAATPLTEGSNSFRLGRQKKPLYVQPPGLNAFQPQGLGGTSNTSITSVPSNNFHIGPPSVGMDATQTQATLQYQSADKQADLSLAFSNQAQVATMYRPVYHHWFYKKEVESKVVWRPFSMVDSLALEEAFTSTEILPETVVSTDGGRYDVNILRRHRLAVYWQESPTEVRRCSWFYKGSSDTRYVPYEENVCTRLEEEFKVASTTNVWHRRVEFPNGEAIVFHGPNVMVHFLQATSPDAWGNTPQTPLRPRIVKRGVDEFDIDEGEPPKVDHLLFLVHGIGSVCDLKFRTVEEVVDDFRSLSLQLVQSHFRSGIDEGKVNRIEVLPVSWHATLHGEDTGIDRKLKSITLNSIPKLRHFTNDTLLDILFYTSPVYCQTIMHTVGKELNRLYSLFKQRNPGFEGHVSLGGHSLGSLILFDLLYHQKVPEEASFQDPATSADEKTENNSENSVSSDGNPNQKVSYVMGNAGTGQPFITYPQLNFQPMAFFALGSPIGMFVTVRGIDTLGEDFKLPTCPGFFNIFHPFDPVAYRIETLVNPELTNLRPILIPHHKGRKRMHLELKETMARVGADLKQKLVESVRSTWNTVYQLAMFHRTDDQALQQEVDKVLEEQLQQQNEMENTQSGMDGEFDVDVRVGQLNGGRRIDYVLQEAPLESFNEYIFALKTHVCYWESEDTMLMILKEVYSTMGVSVDSNAGQQSTAATSASNSSGLLYTGENSMMQHSSSFMSSQDQMSPMSGFPPELHPSPLVSSPYSTPPDNPSVIMGMDPTVPLMENKSLGPPPMAGFVKKSKS